MGRLVEHVAQTRVRVGRILTPREWAGGRDLQLLRPPPRQKKDRSPPEAVEVACEDRLSGRLFRRHVAGRADDDRAGRIALRVYDGADDLFHRAEVYQHGLSVARAQ